MKKYTPHKLSFVFIAAILLSVICSNSSCTKPADNTDTPDGDIDFALLATYFPDTVFVSRWYNKFERHVYVYDNNKRLMRIDILVPLNTGVYVLQYQDVYEYSGAGTLPVKRHYFRTLDSPSPFHTAYLQYDNQGRKIYDSCQDRLSGLHTVVHFVYPDDNHIVVHQKIKNGPVAYITDTIFLRSPVQVDSIRRYSDMAFSAPSAYLYSEYLKVNDTVPNMFFNLPTRQANLYASDPGYRASLDVGLISSFNRLFSKTYSNTVSTSNNRYFQQAERNPDKSPSLIIEKSDSIGGVSEMTCRFKYKR